MAEPIDAGRRAPPSSIDAEVCIIGGGAAGIYLADLLADRGCRTVLLEAGPRDPVEPAALGFVAAMTRERFAGAFEGRRFGLGGSTAQWGGKLVLPTAACAHGDGPEARSWAGLLVTIANFSSAVLAGFGLAEPPDEKTEGIITCRRSWHLGFAERNLRTAFASRMSTSQNLTVVLNAPVVALEPAEGRSAITFARAIAPQGPFTVTARQFVIAAGAIETTRLLLETENRFGRSPFKGSASLGVGLGDHLSSPIARPADFARAAVVTRFGPDFSHGRMRTWRFLAANQRQPAFAHWVFDDPGAAFAVAREGMAAIQARRSPRIAPEMLLRGALDLAALGWTRYARQRLRISPSAQVRLQLDLAQPRRANNRIVLGASRDQLGRRMAEIAWSIDCEDIATFSAAGKAMVAAWNAAEGLPAIVPFESAMNEAKPFDAYHPVGTTFAGSVADGAVLDMGLKVHGMQNLYAASTGAFANAGDANPTFGLLCLVHALADRLATDGKA